MESEDNILRVRSELELEKLLFFYNCQTREELSDHLYREYNATLILEYETDL